VRPPAVAGAAGQAGDFDPGYGTGSSAGAAAMGPAAPVEL